ncbi:probable xyloglucan galactosyltransferase GT19 [Phragmites australis]|uniref:probable xyloglucan galactosyltransferase GT19 n=1 Tax=Phragmites australis TaxID=29695 RepID=UPI002D7952FA|nr:probable xyloglucan galactosyltransferase GT19 [Phragmites australis]
MARALRNLLLLLLLLSIIIIAVSAASHSPDPCAGRRIHVRRLPAHFNTQLLRYCATAFPLADPDSTPDCASLANHALGPRTHNRTRSWYRTDGRLLEPFFHRRILERDCLVHRPALADAVFVPYYAALDALPYMLDPALLNYSALHGLPLAQFLERDRPQVLARHHGHDHFFVLAGPAWDYSQPLDTDPRMWGTTSLLRRPDFDNFTILTLESRAWPWQEHAIPHPTSFHPASLPRLQAWLSRARRSRRTTLMLYAGGISKPSRPNIRGSILAECANRTGACTIVDCSGGACALNPIMYMRPMLKAKFCLEPPGDTPSRRSTFDAIVAGCVPVFFEHAAARLQYGWHLPPGKYDEFSVTIPKESVVQGGVKIAEVLAAVPDAEVASMRARMLEMAPRVVYRRHGSTADLREASKDAVDLAVEGALRRIRRRVHALEDGEPDAIYSLDDDDD